MTAPVDDLRQRFSELVAAVPQAPSSDVLGRRVKRWRRQKRATQGFTTVLLVAVGIAVPVAIQQAHGPSNKIIGTASPGSPGMPVDFVAADLKGHIDLIDSSSGAVVRHLYSTRNWIAAIAATSKDVYAATAGGVYRIPISSGRPTQLSAFKDADTLAISPDGTKLAWGEGANVNGTTWRSSRGRQSALNVPSPTTFTFMNLSTGATRTWTLPSTPSLSYQVDSLGWATDTELAAVTAPLPGSHTFTNCPPARSAPTDDPCYTPFTPPTNVPPAEAHLILIDTTSRSGPKSLTFLGNSQNIEQSAGLLSPGSKPGTLITTILRIEGTHTPTSRLVQLTVTGNRVTVSTIADLPSAGTSQSLDPNGRDLMMVLLAGGTSGDNYTFAILRSTDNGSPVTIVNSGPWSMAAW